MEDSKKIIIKMTTGSPNDPIVRQTPGQKGVWGNFQFHIDDDIKECDWWVVYDTLPKEQTAFCDPKHTILVTSEPYYVKKYDKKYTDQFHAVVTTQKNIKAPRIIPLLLQAWYIGKHFSKDRGYFTTADYDSLKNASAPQKTKLISVISSNKTTTKGHRERLKFVKILQEHFKDRLDVFGSGLNHIEDKWDGIAPYKYHIAIENGVVPNYWTEKLADVFLSGTYPFYFGCPNINDYFPENSLTKIDIREPQKAIEIIEEALKNDYYENRRSEIKTAKDFVLDRYQLFPAICKIIQESPKDHQSSKKVFITLQPERKKKKNIIARLLIKIHKRVNLQ